MNLWMQSLHPTINISGNSVTLLTSTTGSLRREESAVPR